MKDFKTESKKIMDLMINSIYTNKEIFLRELISNASDAIDKIYYESLKNQTTGLNRNDFPITIEADKKERTITITDTGIGMNEKTLEENLGTIAKSGSAEFARLVEKNDEISLIGQFGVGFYSAFMVSDKIEVLTKAYKEDKAYKWTSCGAEGYDICEAEKESNGTQITLHIKESNEDFDYDVFLEEYKLRELIKKYSDYIRYPIRLRILKDKEKGLYDYEVSNSQVPLWRKNKSQVTKEEYDAFYKDMFNNIDEPLDVIHFQIEGKVNFRALLFVPKSIPYGYYTKEYEKGLKLYTNGVMITEKCSELLPDYLNFVKGVVDGELDLNISRETLQQSRELTVIKNQIEDKINAELKRLQKDEREKYIEFFKAFGLQLKYTIYREWGMNKEKMQDLLMYHSVKEDKFITLKEYADKMESSQKYLYYSCGSSIDGCKNLPQTEKIINNGYDVLCMNEEMDEFVIKFLRDYNEKEFKNIMSDDIGIYNDEDEELQNENKELNDYINGIMTGLVERVKFTKDLGSHPVSLSSEGEISLEMERTLNANPNNHEKIVAKKILQINVNHPIFNKIQSLYENDKDNLKLLMEVLLEQGKLVSGLPIEKPSEFVDNMAKLITL